VGDGQEQAWFCLVGAGFGADGFGPSEIVPAHAAAAGGNGIFNGVKFLGLKVLPVGV